MCLRPHSAGSTIPCLRPTGSSRACALRLRPGGSPHALRIPPRDGHPALRLERTRRPPPVCRLRNLLHRCLFVSKVVSSRFLPYPQSPASELLHPLLDIVPGSRDEWDFHPPDSRAVGRTLWASPTPLPPTHALWIRRTPRRARRATGGRGLPVCPTQPSLRLVNIASRRVAGFGFSDRLAALDWCNEADVGSLALRLAGSIHGAPTARLLGQPPASLHAGCPVGMMNTFQFIGFGWRCWRTEGHEGVREQGA